MSLRVAAKRAGSQLLLETGVTPPPGGAPPCEAGTVPLNFPGRFSLHGGRCQGSDRPSAPVILSHPAPSGLVWSVNRRRANNINARLAEGSRERANRSRESGFRLCSETHASGSDGASLFSCTCYSASREPSKKTKLDFRDQNKSCNIFAWLQLLQ